MFHIIFGGEGKTMGVVVVNAEAIGGRKRDIRLPMQNTEESRSMFLLSSIFLYRLWEGQERILSLYLLERQGLRPARTLYCCAFQLWKSDVIFCSQIGILLGIFLLCSTTHPVFVLLPMRCCPNKEKSSLFFLSLQSAFFEMMLQFEVDNLS